MFPLLSEVNG